MLGQVLNNAIKRVIAKIYPELDAGYHLPIFAEVLRAADPQEDGNISENFRPFFAVDVRLLDKNMKVDETKKEIKAVPVGVPGAGSMRGNFVLPKPGAIVEIRFAYASPALPYISCTLGYGSSMPGMHPDDQIWQQSPSSRQMVDAGGNWTRATHGKITDTSTSRNISADENTEHYLLSKKAVDGNDIEEIIGTKVIEALGRIKLASGGRLDLAALGNIYISTGSNIDELIGKIKTSIAKEKQIIKVADGGKVWVGNEANNALKLLEDLAGIVKGLASDLSTHVHAGIAPGSASTAAPTNSSSIAGRSSDAGTVKDTINPMVE